MAAVVVSPIYARFPEYRRYFQYGGMITAGIALIGSAFVTAPWQLIVFIGILHPLRASTVYCELAFSFFGSQKLMTSHLMRVLLHSYNSSASV